MPNVNLMRQGLPETALRTEANCSDDGERIESLGMLELKRISSQILDLGIESYGKAMAFADQVGLQTSVLSEMRRGKRAVPFYVVLGLMSNRQAAQAVIARECMLAGFPAPLTTTIELSTGQAQEIERMRSLMGAAWQHFGEAYAQRFYRVTLDVLDVAVTEHLRMGK